MSVTAQIKDFAKYGREESGGITRLAFSREERAARKHFMELCRNEHLDVRIDAAGNIIARREGEQPDAPAVACGSHLDSVIEGGIYDGTLGVLAGLEVVRRLNAESIRTKHPIEIICFAAEESSRFGISTIGSKAMAGYLDVEMLKLLKDKDGYSFGDVVAQYGLNINNFGNAKRSREELKAFLELHVEQGPVLEKHSKKIGIVKAVAAPTRIRTEVFGQAGHSGTTTMSLRRDALSAAAEIVLEVERIARQESRNNVVGTVGVLNISPGAVNVIPGYAELIVEFRSVYTETKKRVLKQFETSLARIAKQRKVDIQTSVLSDEQPVILDQNIIRTIERVCREHDYSFLHMVSGAGHDAMNIAAICPTGLIFVPSYKGISHHPAEFTADQDIEIGVEVLYHTIFHLAKGEKRT